MLTSVSTEETRCANGAVPAFTLFLTTSSDIISCSYVLREENGLAAFADVVCETELRVVSGNPLLNVLQVGWGAGGTKVTHLERFCRLRMSIL